MKLAHTAPFALVFAAVLAAGLATARQDEQPTRRTFKDLTPEEMSSAQQKMLELGAPGPEHDQLAKYVGTFVQEIKINLPGMGEMVGSGTAEHELVLGGRYLMVTAKAEIPMFGESESITMWGFDRRNGEFTNIGFDTLGTYWVTAQGASGASDRGAVLHGEDYDASLDVWQIYDLLVEFVDDDSFKTSLVFHDMFEEGPFTMVEITSRRRSAPGK